MQLKLKSKMIQFILLFVGIVGSLNSDSVAQERPDYITEKTASFYLTVEGLAKAEGELRIAVFNSQDTYTVDPMYAVVLSVDSTVVDWQVDELPFGEYAIAVYHDKNANGKLDTNLLGIPKSVTVFQTMLVDGLVLLLGLIHIFLSMQSYIRTPYK